MLQEKDYPISVMFDAKTGIFNPCKQTVERKVSDLKMMFHDQQAVRSILSNGLRDPLLSFCYQQIGHGPGCDSHLPG